jgi:hypothetical protein
MIRQKESLISFMVILLQRLTFILNFVLKISTIKLFCCFQKDSLRIIELPYFVEMADVIPLRWRFWHELLMILLNELSLLRGNALRSRLLVVFSSLTPFNPF